MSYLGGAPAKSIASPTSQFFSGNNSTTTFTLNRSVNVPEDLEVFVNNVQQEPGSGKSYTAAGTTLTFDAAPGSGTNNVYVVYRGLSERAIRLEADNVNATVSGALFTSGSNKTKTDLFQVNSQTVSSDVTIAATENASITGPITVATGVTVTVATGGTLVTL
tara:strand:+ start:5911 stop:6399 length:489 start_codon:yes stop_codon:yes gene_type:complete